MINLKQNGYILQERHMNKKLMGVCFALFIIINPLKAMKMYSSGTVKDGDPKLISLDISGVNELYLIVKDGGDGIGSDHAVWGEPVLETKSGDKVSLSTLKPFISVVGWGKVGVNKYENEASLKIGRRQYDRGFYTHAESVLAFKLEGNYNKFTSEVGLQAGKPGSVEFIVLDRPLPNKSELPSFTALELAIKDLINLFGNKYPNGQKYLDQLSSLKKQPDSVTKSFSLINLQREALLSNPLITQCDKILAVKRQLGNKARKTLHPATPSMNTYTLEQVNSKSSNDEIVTISNLAKTPKVERLFKSPKGGVIAEIELHYDADKIMYSAGGSEGMWHLHEVSVDGKYLGQLTPKGVEYNSFDSTYLPTGDIVYNSTAPMQGLPCESGRIRLSNTYLLEPKTKKIRRLTFDQEANWFPSVLDDGRVMFLRWEYSDTAHYFTRILMTMNPDGTMQRSRYGSNSYWPNAINCPIQIPGAPTQFIGVISGLHVGRSGRLCLFDTSKGRHEAEGAVQMLPGYGKPVLPIIQDHLYGNHYPKFLNPIPLGTSPKDGAGNYFLVSGKMSKSGLWGLYLIDRFDNIVKIVEEEGYAFNEPLLFKKRVRPPVIPSRIDLTKTTAQVFISNIYEGPGLKDIPKGTVKKIRVFTYHYSYYHSGSHEALGAEASWDVKRILGEVPVYQDGSAMFEIPANMPIVLQPIDKNGAALQLMRSWLVGMPGEVVSCVGCHEDQNNAVANNRMVEAFQHSVSKIEPWHGPARNFSFLREVQPVLNKKCISCHNPKTKRKTLAGTTIPDFATLKLQKLVYDDMYSKRGDADGGPFSVSYNNLNPYTRRPGPESDYRLLNPMEYHAGTSPLVQILQRGHHGVKLTKEEWEKINAWIDMNVPFWGSWTDAHENWANVMHMKWSGSGSNHAEQLKNIEKYRNLRTKYQKIYSTSTLDFEGDRYPLPLAVKKLAKIKTVKPKENNKKIRRPKLPGWPMKSVASTKRQVIEVPGGTIAMRLIPAGQFIMGDEKVVNAVPCKVTIKKSFWMAEKEVMNKLYREFSKDHYSGFIDMHGKDQTTPGFDAGKPEQSVIRVSWKEAVAFAHWLSKKTGKKFRLPTEAE